MNLFVGLNRENARIKPRLTLISVENVYIVDSHETHIVESAF